MHVSGDVSETNSSLTVYSTPVSETMNPYETGWRIVRSQAFFPGLGTRLG